MLGWEWHCRQLSPLKDGPRPKSVGLPAESLAPFGVAVVPNFTSPSTQKIVCSIGMLAIGWPAPLVGLPGLGPGSNTLLVPEETPAGRVVSTEASLAVVVVLSVVVNVVKDEVVPGVLAVVSPVVATVPVD